MQRTDIEIRRISSVAETDNGVKTEWLRKCIENIDASDKFFIGVVEGAEKELETMESTITAQENKIYELEDKERQLVDMIDAREDYIDTLEEKLKGVL